VYTEFGRRQIERALAQAVLLRPDLVIPPVDVVPHGVDTATFHPSCGRGCSDLRCAGRHDSIARLFGHGSEMKDAFIVLNANRNQPRKRIDITIAGFAEFAAGKPPNVKLHLHMGLEDLGWNVIRLAKRHGIDDRLILTSQDNNLPSVPDRQLNDIYNAAVIGVNTSVGEGWGLVSFEHAATGAAQIVPRHSACEELWTGAAMFLDPVAEYTMPKTLTDARLVSASDLARTLEVLYSDADLLSRMSAAARAKALQPSYEWPRIAATWIDILDAVVDR
jgi:glycosyltransferase involved in cell wall biosynthesis